MSGSHGHEGWYLIVNPQAGAGRVARLWPRLVAMLEAAGVVYETVFTTAPLDAVPLAREAVKAGWRRFAVVGGDGTLSETAEGLLTQQEVPTQELILGIIPVGTGNDWRRMYGIPDDPARAVTILREGRTLLQDVGLIRYTYGENMHQRHFLNIAGFGFDAEVTARANRRKQQGHNGLTVYLRTLLSSLFSYRPASTTLRIDEQTLRDDIFTISVGIGRYSGGGMRQTPRAIPDDGLFDITVIRRIGKADIILHLGMLFNGRLPEHPKVVTFRGKKIRITATPPLAIEADGETLGHTPAEILLLEKKIGVVTGPERPR